MKGIMKQADIMAAVMAGKHMTTAEFREYAVKQLPGSNGREGGVLEQFFLVIGRETVEGHKWCSKGTKLEQVPASKLKPGQRVVVELSTLERTRFGTRARIERIEPLE